MDRLMGNIDEELRLLSIELNGKLEKIEAKDLTWLAAYRFVYMKLIEDKDILKEDGYEFGCIRIREDWCNLINKDKERYLNLFREISLIGEINNNIFQDYCVRVYRDFKDISELITDDIINDFILIQRNEIYMELINNNQVYSEYDIYSEITNGWNLNVSVSEFYTRFKKYNGGGKFGLRSFMHYIFSHREEVDK